MNFHHTALTGDKRHCVAAVKHLILRKQTSSVKGGVISYCRRFVMYLLLPAMCHVERSRDICHPLDPSTS